MKKKKKNKGCLPIATFICVCLRNKDKRITYFPCEASKRVSEEVVNSWIQRKRRSSLLIHPSLPSALFFLFAYFLFLLPIFLCLFHLRVFVLGGSYPLYTATRLKVRNWPVRYIAWVLSFCGAIEITVIWELPPVQLRREGKIERLPSKEIALHKFLVENISAGIARVAIFVYAWIVYLETCEQFALDLVQDLISRLCMVAHENRVHTEARCKLLWVHIAWKTVPRIPWVSLMSN